MIVFVIKLQLLLEYLAIIQSITYLNLIITWHETIIGIRLSEFRHVESTCLNVERS